MSEEKQNATTFPAAFALLLDRLDAAYQQLRAQHADPVMMNEGYEKYTKAAREFKEIQQALFAFKSVWYQVRELDQ